MSQFIIYISFENIKQCMYLIQILNQIYQIFLTHFCLYFGTEVVYDDDDELFSNKTVVLQILSQQN
jgi:hypothetical protein